MPITIEQAESASSPFFDRKLWDNVYFESTFFKMLRGKKRMKRGGVNLRWPIDYRELGTADARGPRDQISIRTRDTRTSVRTDWKYYDAQTMLNVDERVENAGKAQIYSLIKEKADELQEDLGTRLSRDVYTANPNGKGINDLPTLISSSAFGGVDEATYRSPTRVVATLGWFGDTNNDLMHYMNGSLFGTNRCDTLLMSPQLKTMLEAKWVKATARYELTADATLTELGIRSWQFDAANVVADQRMAETTALKQTLYGLEMKALMCYESSVNTTTGTWLDGIYWNFPGALVRNASWCGDLVIRRRRTSFRLTGITAVADVA